jgi:uncharacterized membrane protein
MSKLIALVFKEIDSRDAHVEHLEAVQSGDVVEPRPQTALANWKTIRQAAKEGGVKIEDAVIIWKASQGEIKVIQTQELTASRGARRGAFWGLLVGLVLGGPLAGVLWGLGIGAVTGKVVDHGIDNKVLKDLTDTLTPLTSAILILIKPEDYERSIAYLRTFDTKIFEADFDDGAIEALRKVAEDEQIAKATKAHFGEESE